MQDDLDMIDSQELMRFSQESFSNFFTSSLEDCDDTVVKVDEGNAVTMVNSQCAQQYQNMLTQESVSSDLIPTQFAISLENITPELLGHSLATWDVPQTIQPVAIPQVSSCLPPSNNWPGLYEFDVFFDSPPSSSSKKAQWIYSPARDKLYANMNTACPITLYTKTDVPPNTLVRFKALFMQPFHIDDHVQRCLNHKNLDLKAGVQNADHVIQCESDEAQYEVERNGTCSVIIPYVHQWEDNFLTILKFTCFNSCTGGMNRKATKLIITLEYGGEVFGRRTLELKICACPGRDFNNDEKLKSSKKKYNPDESPPEKCKAEKRKCNYSSHLSDVFHFLDDISNISSKRPKVNSKQDSPYVLKVNSKEELNFVTHCYKLYKLGKTHQCPSQSDDDSSYDSEPKKKKK